MDNEAIYDFWEDLNKKIVNLPDAILKYLHEQDRAVFVQDFYNSYFGTTTGIYISEQLNKELRKLEVFEFIRPVNVEKSIISITEKGKKIFLELPPNELDSPFTNYINREAIKNINHDLLIELQIKSNLSTIETNRINRITNIFIAIFTGIAACWYFNDLLIKNISDCVVYKSEIATYATIILFLLGIYGVLRIGQLNKKVLNRGSGTK